MIETLPETTRINTSYLVGLLGLTGIIAIFGILYLPRLISLLLVRFFPPKSQEAYQQIIAPYSNWLGLILLLTSFDIIILTNVTPYWLDWLEIPVGLFLSFLIIWVGTQICKEYFDVYLLDIAIKSKRKVNSELLIVAKFFANASLILVVVFIFAQNHAINLLGLLASLGVGGLAIAFAAQKTLEQVLGGIVLYIDRPFVVDDYIGLPDGTFGRVETIGLRSTKIRTSGKGTLMIVPNNAITQINIENYTGGKKVISLFYLNFYRLLPSEEKALIRQIILESTNDIFGIDPRSTEVSFKDVNRGGKTEVSQAQVNFFILGSGDVSMDLRRQLLDIASLNITQQLQEYGIPFEISDQMVNVDSPITI